MSWRSGEQEEPALRGLNPSTTRMEHQSGENKMGLFHEFVVRRV